MSIYEYDGEKTGPAGFVGLRVIVSVGSKRKQRYFSFKDGRKGFVDQETEDQIRKLANEYHEQLLIEQELAKKERIKTARQTAHPLYATRVRGIILNVQVKKRGDKTYYTPHFQVNVAEGFANVYIKKEAGGFDRAWRQAVEKLAELKGIENYAHLMRRKPKGHRERISLIIDNVKRQEPAA